MKPTSLSASSLQVAEKCLKRFEVEYIDRVRGGGNDAARLGTACHAALEDYTRRCILGGYDSERTWDTLRGYYEGAFADELGPVAAKQDVFDDGLTMLEGWFERNEDPSLGGNRLFDRVKVVSAESKEEFQIPSSIGPIPFRFIMDRVDLDHVYGEHIAYDYKTVRFPLSTEEMRNKLQFRVYAMVMQMKYPGQSHYWVYADNLRHDAPTGVAFTPEDNQATWEYLLALTERIVAAENPQPTLNSECIFCPVREQCPEVQKSITVGDLTSMTTEARVDLFAQLTYQKKAVDAAVDRVSKFLSEEAINGNLRSLESETYALEFGRSRRREVVNPRELEQQVGSEVFNRYGGPSITVGQLDKMKNDPDLSDEAKLYIAEQGIAWKKGDLKPKVKEKK